MDERASWQTLRNLKKSKQPKQFNWKDSSGEHIHIPDLAENAASYFASHQWGRPEGVPPPSPNRQDKIVTQDLGFNDSPITIDELRRILKKCKRRKATGPDEIPMELILEMHNDNLLHICRAFINAQGPDFAVQTLHRCADQDAHAAE